ncbi:MAG: histidine triad nucleotide-binding protein [Cetobacterium sp.]|uniref:histidine triad nucleotide-binding protein n=1 Tax=unclassified Cetobacterium TaxID=2630983 RepID=UPI00163CB237|nr:histidine triad nucleotide-binding protein [Cetobacterium sp. 2A]MBC2856712.1 histidine triad nucleotide-binding protein [Cetobacterium sp. 2A]
MATIFTKIINREIPANIVFENDKVIAFKDINPLAPVHILVVPKKEIPTINDISDEDKELIGEMYIAIKEIAKAFNIDESGYRVITNCNEHGGQEVFHLHFHILGGEALGFIRG